MLCSNCSDPIKPVVAIDIDGTLGNYHTHFLDFAVMWLGVERPQRNYHGDIPFKLWVSRALGIDVTTFRTIKLAYRQGGMKRSMPILPGARELTQRVRAADAELWLTTTRPHDRYDRVDPDTRAWLDRNGIKYDALLFGDRKMNELRERVEPERVVAVLDDLTPVLVAARHLFGPKVPILARGMYNDATHWSPAVSSCGSAGRLIKIMIDEWRGRHQ